jgi:hypothetical protein
MEKKIICIFVSMLMFATVFTVAGTKNINETNEITIASQSNQAEPLLNPGDILIDFDATTAHGNGGNLGAEWDGQYFWSTGCAAGPAAPYNIYKWDIDGNLLNTYPQPSQPSSTWGFRDMAFDGTYLYAGSEAGLWKIDPATGATTLMFSSIAPMAVIRALTWVPSEGMFYSGNFANSFYKFPPSGSPITPVTNPSLTAVYGMAYDSINDSIWVFDQTGTPQTIFIEYNYHTQTLTGTTWQIPLLTGSTAQLAGGAFYATSIVTGKSTLGGMTQGTPLDRIFVMELGITNLPPNTPGAPSGEDQGVVGVEYTFTATTTDPEGDPIEYWFEWGDGQNSGWVSPGSAKHVWTSAGNYNVKVKAKDSYGGESTFSPDHPIEILGGPLLHIKTVKGGLFKIKVTIENNGGVDATGVAWTISLAGGAIIGKESSGTVDIPAGEKAVVTSKAIMGFGKTEVTVTANVDESSDTATRHGNIYLFYIYVRPGGS